MKANEAPEKIYVHVRYKPCEITFSEVKEEGFSNVEYTRTDAFVEKACKYLEPNVKMILCGDKIDTDKFIEDFRKYMKGE